jgi:predicted DNA-binding protein with PD1-like motif
MRSRLLQEEPERVYALIFESGEEVAAGLLAFAREKEIGAATVSGIGAFRDVTLAYFDPDTRAYTETPFDEQTEVLSLLGNFTLHDGAPKIHAHVVLGRRDGSSLGGHLVTAHVAPTLELFVRVLPGAVQRSVDPASGLPLIDLG